MATMNIHKPHRINRMQRQEAIQGYLFAAPWIIGFLLFTLYPMISSLFYSFTNYNMTPDYKWIGLTNYKILFGSDYLIPISAKNTLFYAIISVPLNLTIGLMIAVLMNQKIKGIKLFRTIYYLPIKKSFYSLGWLLCRSGRRGLLLGRAGRNSNSHSSPICL